MRRTLFLLAVLALTLRPGVARGQGAQAVGASAAAQQQILATQTAYLLELYALQNGGPPTPEAQADLSRRAAEYFTNGAKATAVPTAGPAASYFTNGAAVTTAPTSMIPDYTFAPPAIATTEPQATRVDAGETPAAETRSPPRAPLPAAEAGALPEEATQTNGTALVVEPPPEGEENAASTPPIEEETFANTPSAAALVPTPRPAPGPSASTPPVATLMGVEAPQPRETTTSSVLWVMGGGLGVGGVLVLLGVALGPGRRGRGRRPT